MENGQLVRWIPQQYHDIVMIPIGLSSVDVLVMLPVIFLTVGKDFIGLICFCYITSLLVITQLPKRLIWRYRPYMVSRAIMVRMYIVTYTSIVDHNNCWCFVSISDVRYR